MEKIIKKVLNTLEKSGFEAYVVGGYIRDLLLKHISYDVDICTNALPKDLVKIFPNGNLGIYGAVSFKIGKYSFEITTYRKEFNYQNRHPKKVEYTSNLLEDIQRRDFKINTICINQRENIIDIMNATDDLNNRVITCVGNPDIKIKEDPLRILRAIRLATVLDFIIDKSLENSILKNNELVKTLSDTRIIDEFTKILISENYLKGMELLSKLKILDNLGISFNNMEKTSDINGMWAQLSFKKNLAFSKETLHNINTIKQIVDIGCINEQVLFEYGLYYSMVAGEILHIDKKRISSIYKKMPIKSKKDLALSTEKIVSLLSKNDGQEIKSTLNNVVNAILTKKIKNKAKDIYKFVERSKI